MQCIFRHTALAIEGFLLIRLMLLPHMAKVHQKVTKMSFKCHPKRTPNYSDRIARDLLQMAYFWTRFWTRFLAEIGGGHSSATVTRGS